MDQAALLDARKPSRDPTGKKSTNRRYQASSRWRSDQSRHRGLAPDVQGGGGDQAEAAPGDAADGRDRARRAGPVGRSDAVRAGAP